MIALTPRVRHPYVLFRDRDLPSGERTTFFIRTLTIEERAALADRAGEYAQSSGTVQMRSGTQALTTVRAGLVGWDNLGDGGGGTVPFTTGPERAVLGGHKVAPVVDECLVRLDWEAITELAAAIRDSAELSEEDAKNS